MIPLIFFELTQPAIIFGHGRFFLVRTTYLYRGGLPLLSGASRFSLSLQMTISTAHDYIIEDLDFSRLDEIFVLKHSIVTPETESRYYFELQPRSIKINAISFDHSTTQNDFPIVTIIRQLNDLILTCSCEVLKQKMCAHMSQALNNIVRRTELRLFFDEQLRRRKLLEVAQEFGLEKEPNLDALFDLEYNNKTITITPTIKELYSSDTQKKLQLKSQLVVEKINNLPAKIHHRISSTTILIFSEHRYYKQFKIELYHADLTQSGKVKNVHQPIDPSALIWATDDAETIKFFSAVSRFQHSYDDALDEQSIEALKALIKNPLGLPVFLHSNDISSNFTGSSLTELALDKLAIDLHLSVDLRDDLYELSGQLTIYDTILKLDLLRMQHSYFLLHTNRLHLIDDIAVLKAINYFRKHHNRIVIHASKFEAFRQDILLQLERKISITYSYLKPASQEQLVELNIDEKSAQIIYLSDAESHILLTPVLKYGNTEVPVLSKMNIYAKDKNGTEFLVERNKELELKFLSILLLQQPEFAEQLHNDCFYLSKDIFLDESWFLDAFELWRQHEITVLGFNDLKDNSRNPHRAKVSVSVNSGLDWFETSIKLTYGTQKASLKHLHKAIRDKSKYVQLGDGSLGLLPQEWIQKFDSYFKAGEIIAEEIRTSKINFSAIDSLYESEVLADDVKAELKAYHQRIQQFNAPKNIPVPEDLIGNLRDYQHEGLNWMHLLDELNFGGCLADDMGLGKTVQVIAFILSQRQKRLHNTNLIVVPTTLIFNWKAEIEKFAPTIKVHTIHGSDRIKNSHEFDQFEVILTSYGTLLNDIRFLKEYYFNYIFLDESQNIKNPESQRYKAVRLLHSRNKMVLTGTPVENNTFDLYGQLSFACPGLLGNKQHFKEQYSTPIDKFGNTKRAAELQQKTNPFILRRTKKQVAKELPEKTEMVSLK